jgi:hypothetical protein
MPPSAPLARVASRVLPRPLFSRLARAVRALGTEGLEETYRRTFWFDFGPPAAVAEEAILALRPRVAGSLPSGLAGVEWWLSRMRTNDVQVDFHRDRDEVLFGRTGRVVHPELSSVLFINRCRGGLLAVLDAPPNDANPARAPDSLAVAADLIRPWPNRFVVFPGHLTHGVLDARNGVPRGRLPAPTPLRLALVLNWWTRRPAGVSRFAHARKYAALRLPRKQVPGGLKQRSGPLAPAGRPG